MSVYAYAVCASRPPCYILCFFWIGLFAATTVEQMALQVMPDDHSKLVPPLPIPNRTVKRLCADDSASTCVKVGNRQASIEKPLVCKHGGFCFARPLCAASPSHRPRDSGRSR